VDGIGGTKDVMLIYLEALIISAGQFPRLELHRRRLEIVIRLLMTGGPLPRSITPHARVTMAALHPEPSHMALCGTGQYLELTSASGQYADKRMLLAGRSTQHSHWLGAFSFVEIDDGSNTGNNGQCPLYGG
jgi:hypothetical protein